MIGEIREIHENHGEGAVESPLAKCPIYIRAHDFAKFGPFLIGRKVRLDQLDASSGRLWASASLIEEDNEDNPAA